MGEEQKEEEEEEEETESVKQTEVWVKATKKLSAVTFHSLLLLLPVLALAQKV